MRILTIKKTQKLVQKNCECKGCTNKVTTKEADEAICAECYERQMQDECGMHLAVRLEPLSWKE